jgi:hypothetical protein
MNSALELLQLFAAWAVVDGALLVAGGWEFVPLMVGRELAAIAAIRGTEIHFAASPEWRGRVITRRRTREFLEPLFEERGFLTTRVAPESVDPTNFIERLGFVLTHVDARGVKHYMLSALPYGPKES